MNSDADLDHRRVADRYRVLADRFSALLAAVPSDRWVSPSPCEGWSALDVVGHVISTQADLFGRMPFAPVDNTDAIDMSDPQGAWITVRDQMQSALDSSESANHTYDGFFGPTTFAATVDSFYSFDLVVHTWDIATATEVREFQRIDPREMSTNTDAMSGMGDNLRMPGILGPALDVPPGADEQTTFLAFLGRRAP